MDNIKVKVVEFGDRQHYQMQFVDPLTRKKKTRSTGVLRDGSKKARAEAEKAAGKWESELHEGRYHARGKISWAEFRERYEAEKAPSLADGTAVQTQTVMNQIEELINPQRLADLTPDLLSVFQAQLRSQKNKEATISGKLGHLQASLGWAKSIGLIREVPEITKPKRAKGTRLMKGRPVTGEEFDRMLAATDKVRPHDAANWKHYLTGLWLSGLRLEESLVLSWDDEGTLLIDLSGKHPRLRIWADAEKGNQDRLLPLTPDFAEWLLKTPKEQRVGRVFRLNGLLSGKPITPKRVSRVVSAIGKKAGVIVNKIDGKYASAHDLRRSFGTRWASKVKPATLQLLMRHESIETTLKYYVDQDADDVASELWNQHVATGNTFGNSGPETWSRRPATNVATTDANNVISNT